MQPPSSPSPFATPFRANTPGGGQVVSIGAMKSSIENGRLRKWLVGSQSAASGGEVRLTSSWRRQS